MARVLVLAPHADDETLGMGGTIAKHVDQGDEVHVVVVTSSPLGLKRGHLESLYPPVRAEATKVIPSLGVASVEFAGLPPVLLPDEPVWKTNQVIHAAMERHMPEILYVPFPYDMHGDHRAVFHAASVAWRPTSDLGRGIRRILAYEVLSETHWNAPYLEPGFTPNVFVELSEGQLKRKLEALGGYATQMKPFPNTRSVEAIEALARWRGSLQGMAAAEGFVLIRETLR